MHARITSCASISFIGLLLCVCVYDSYTLILLKSQGVSLALLWYFLGMLSDTELDHIAKLARVRVAPEKRETLKKDLSAILGYIEKLNKTNTSSVEPLYQTTGLVNATRSDESRAEFPMTDKLEELLIGQAPARKERFVKVKSILKK